MGTTVKVKQYPLCDICGDGKTLAKYDGATRFGPWANMCDAHFVTHGVGLGTGVGQEYVLAPQEPDNAMPYKEWLPRVESAVEDFVGDADYYSLWESGLTPKEAIRQIMADAMSEYGF